MNDSATLDESRIRSAGAEPHADAPRARAAERLAGGEFSTVGDVTVPDPIFSCRHVNVYYGEKHAIRDVSIDIARQEVLAMIGPSGCGKSTFLRCLNRMNDTIPSARVTGSILLDGRDIYDRKQDVVQLRARVGMVFQKPNPFPKSIYENVAYGPRIHGLAADRVELDEIVHTSLQRAGLWDEVKDRLSQPATSLSGGQQQRLCIARTIAVNPEVILMDEPFSALDPVTREDMQDLASTMLADRAVLLVTHDPAEACHMADRIYVLSGRPASLNLVATLALPKPRDPLSTPVLPHLRALQNALREAHPR